MADLRHAECEIKEDRKRGTEGGGSKEGKKEKSDTSFFHLRHP